MKEVRIYTDGACSKNPGKGGWGAVLIFGEKVKEISGFEGEATNNKMEIMAVIMALSELKTSCKVKLFSDSKYVLDGISVWIKSWKKNGWKTANKQPVKNQELWQKLDELASLHELEFNWVRGHNGDFYNELADKLATDAIKNAKI